MERSEPFLTVLTGFLGSGKTTLLNHLLTADHGLRLGILINEFGEVAIDSDLIEERSQDVVALRNGCVCCAVQDDLDGAIDTVLRREPQPEGLVLETTGLADPLPLAERFVEQSRSGVHLDGFVTLVDAAAFDTNLRQADVAEYQIMFGDFLVLNKVDLVAARERDRVRRRLRDLNPTAPIFVARHGRVDPRLLLGAGRFDPDRLLPTGSRMRSRQGATNVRHHHEFESAAYTSRRPLRLADLEAWLDALPPAVVRGKGVLWVEDLDRQVIVQVVGARRETHLGPPWAETDRWSRLVLIGTRSMHHTVEALKDAETIGGGSPAS